jgi:maltooligosyltrehalose trehalohydrolase
MGPDGVSFRIFAPGHDQIEVVFVKDGTTVALEPEGNGFWSGLVGFAHAGDRYLYRLDGRSPDWPDPAAHFLPEGPHAAAEIVGPAAFAWTDDGWKGIATTAHVIYELHVGTFTPEGTWAALAASLPALRDVGITTLEVMPVAEFAGQFGWGYDGVAWYAPSHLYGRPDDFRAFVNRAHALGLAVILDVVYNHFGASGDYSSKFSPHYIGKAMTEWGPALNYDGEQCHAMRSLAVDNAAYWIAEYHLDGLRLDATQSIQDSSAEHIITAIVRAARAAATGRSLLLVGESEPQDARLLRDHHQPGVGSRLDALWDDDFHHSAHVALTGRRQAYYSDYRGGADEWATAVRGGFLYQGQRSAWQSKSRGRATVGLSMRNFVCFLENHDQVANSLWNVRLWQESNLAAYRAMTALWLLGPWTPMFFQGQEWCASSPFRYFADHAGELATQVKEGRAEFLSQFPGCSSHPHLLCNPSAPATFEASRLRWAERELPAHTRALRLHRDLLRIRASQDAFSAVATREVATLSQSCMVIRCPGTSSEKDERLLLVNLGADFELPLVTEPLLRPPSVGPSTRWRMFWSSEDPDYGGNGCAELNTADGRWSIPALAAVLLEPSL